MEKQAYTVEMEAAKAIYKILTEFEKQLDNEEADSKLLDYRTWKISETRFFNYMQILSDAGLIQGVTVEDGPNGMYMTVRKPKITLRGIEYLVENGAMQTVSKIVNKVADLTIGVVTRSFNPLTTEIHIFHTQTQISQSFQP